MRQFSPEYLEHTREGMWDDGREALADLALASRQRVLDVGCGTGEFTAVLREESQPDADVIGVDADTDLLRFARGCESDPGSGLPKRPDTDRTQDRNVHDDRAGDGAGPRAFAGALQCLAGDATRLPIADDAVDLAACQALLINLPDPAVGVRELVRVSTDLVAAVEPNNAEVAVSSTVDREADLEREARNAYLDGVDTNVALGDRVPSLFTDAGLVDVRTRRYLHEKRTAPPYDEAALQAAARKASGAGLADHRAELRAALSTAAYDDLRRRWRALGRDVIDAMRDGTYERVELVPFEVTVGRVSDEPLLGD
ncbi:MAG: methyltransferase domain-containing protein [Halorubrum sp.]